MPKPVIKGYTPEWGSVVGGLRTGQFSVVGTSDEIISQEIYVSISGTFTGTVTLERFIGGTWAVVDTFTAPEVVTFENPKALRMRLHCTALSGGTVIYAIEDVYVAQTQIEGPKGDKGDKGDSGSAHTDQFASRAAIESTNIPIIVNMIRTEGFSASGDGGHGMYQRATGTPYNRSNPGHVQSDDGAWWSLVPEGGRVRIQQFGARLDYHLATAPVNGSPGFTVNLSPTDNFQPIKDATEYKFSNGSTWEVWGAGFGLWAVDQATFTEVPGGGPDGVSSAWLLTENSATNQHVPYHISGIGLTSGEPVVVRASCKPNGRTRVKLALIPSGGLTQPGVEFLCTGSGTVGTADTNFVGSITALAGGWYTIEITFTPSVSSTLYPALYSQASAGSISYAGDGTSGFYFADPEFELAGVTYTSVNELFQQSFSAGLIVELGSGSGYCSDTIVPERATTFSGTTSAYQKSGAGSRLYFPAGKTGIVINTNYGVVGAIVSRIENVALIAIGKSGTAHGIDVNGLVEVSNVYIDGFSGDGIHLDANPPSQIADMSLLHRVWCNENGGDGIALYGGDANVIYIENCSCTSNTGWGYRDLSFLAVVLICCHEAYNGLGAYYLVGSTSPSIALGCYSEGGGQPSYAGPQTSFIGGSHIAGITGIDGSGGLLQWGKRFVGGLEVFTDQTQAWALLCEQPDTPFAYKYGVNGLPMRWRNFGSHWGTQWAGALCHSGITTDAYTFTAGRLGPTPVSPTQLIGFGGIFLGGMTESSCRNLTFSSAVPTLAGVWAEGEIRLNDGTGADNLLGWKCTTGGFTGSGTWTTGMTIFADQYWKASNGHWYHTTTNALSTVEPTHTATIGQQVTYGDGLTWVHLGVGDAVWQGMQITLV